METAHLKSNILNKDLHGYILISLFSVYCEQIC